MRRAGFLLGATVLSVLLSGCSAYNAVSQGHGGATSPSESGQQGAYANQGATDTDPASEGPYPLTREKDAGKKGDSKSGAPKVPDHPGAQH